MANKADRFDEKRTESELTDIENDLSEKQPASTKDEADWITKELVNVRDLRIGDCVEIDGVLQTVDRRYLKYDPFWGYTFKGSTFHKGILKVRFRQYYQGKVVG